MAKKTAMIRARMEPELKNEAESILKNLGLNPTDAITMFYTQITLKKGIPFSINLEEGDIPENYLTIKSDDHLKSIIGLD